MKKSLNIFFAVLFVLLLWRVNASADLVEVEDKLELNRKIAMVNGAEIRKKDFKWALTSEVVRLTALIGYLTDEEMVDLKKKTYDRLINRELLYQESRRMGIEISPMDIETAYKRVRGSMMAPVDKEKISQTLDLTDMEIKDEFRRAFAAQMVVDKNVPFDRTVSEDEIKAYFAINHTKFDRPGRVKVSHIVIEFPESPNPAQKALARSTIEEVKHKLEKGESFEELAKEYSTSLSRVNGGAIGYLPRGRADKAFENAAYALKPGEMSGIVESAYGYHIIKVTEREPDVAADLNNIETKNTIAKFVLEEKESLAIREYINTLKEKSTIEVFLGPLEIQ